MRTHALEQRVVLAAVRLEVDGEIEERLREPTARDEEEHDQDAAQPPVAADERVDGFELRMSHGALHEIGQPIALGHEALKVVERSKHLRHRRRDVRGSGQRRVGRPDPVLCGPKLAWRSRCGRFAVQQALVQTPDQAQVQGMRADTLDTVHQGREHVAHRVELVEAGAGRRRGDLVEQNLREAHAGALHARRTEGFLAQERRHHR